MRFLLAHYCYYVDHTHPDMYISRRLESTYINIMILCNLYIHEIFIGRIRDYPSHLTNMVVLQVGHKTCISIRLNLQIMKIINHEYVQHLLKHFSLKQSIIICIGMDSIPLKDVHALLPSPK